MAKVKVFQVNLDRDMNRVGFMGYDFVLEKQKKLDASIYDCVFDGNVETDDLDNLFMMCNLNKPNGYVGRSMSVSDVVKMNDDYYYVDDIGFVKIPFDETKTQMSKRFAL